MTKRSLALLIVLALGAMSCSVEGEFDPSGALDRLEESQDTTDATAATDADDVQATSQPDEGVGDVDSGVEAPPATSGEPVVRVPDNGGPIEASNWLARTSMSATAVELVWSPVDDAKTYRLYRWETAEADYDAITAGDLSGGTEVFEGNEYGYIDTDAPTNTFVTYAVVAELDDGLTEPRWTEALTIDDTTPPTPVENLVATVTDEGVLLSWTPSTDDVEFASYNVSLLAEDGTAQYLGGGADEGQTSFLDNNPLSGVNKYVITAVDFHNNRSEPALIDVEVDLR